MSDSADKAPISLCIPEIGGNEWNYVKECLDTGWISSVGSYVTRFEECLAREAGVPHATATVNGTAALHIALILAGVQPNDEVITSTLTFIAPANAIRYTGAWPVFIDADPDYWQIDVAKISEFLMDGCERRDGVLRNKETGRRVVAILPVHVLGHPVDMDPLLDLAHKYQLTVIEDATESLGASYRDRKVGSLGDMACFSFNGNKLITTGGGGMLVTADQTLANRARYLTTQAKDDPIEYIHKEIGYNYRLTNIQAAFGCAQMERVAEFVQNKRCVADKYRSALASVEGIHCMREANWAYSTHWMFTILVDAGVYGLDSRALMARLAEKSIQTRPLWQPLHLSPAHKLSPCIPCPVAESLYTDALSLPCSVGITDSEIDRVIAAIIAHSSDK